MSLAKERAQLEKVGDHTTQKELLAAIKTEYGWSRSEFQPQTLPGGPRSYLSPIVFRNDSVNKYVRLLGVGETGWVLSELTRHKEVVIGRRRTFLGSSDVISQGRIKLEGRPYVVEGFFSQGKREEHGFSIRLR